MGRADVGPHRPVEPQPARGDVTHAGPPGLAAASQADIARVAVAASDRSLEFGSAAGLASGPPWCFHSRCCYSGWGGSYATRKPTFPELLSGVLLLRESTR